MKAILISGFEKPEKGKEDMPLDFIDDCKSLTKYLLKKVGLKKKDILAFDPMKIKRLKLHGLFGNISKFIGLYSNEPLIIYYSGHGEEGHWNMRANSKNGESKYFFKFPRLLRILRKRSAPLIVIADCCYGMYIRKELKKLSYPWLLLGLAPETRVGFSSVWPQIKLLWSNRRIAVPLYNNYSGRLVKSVKFKSFNKKLYGFKYGVGKHLRKFFFSYRYKRTKVNLRAGSDLDHLMYPKK
ncbi:MAG: hypothetical protein AAB626_01085 [Patescibacteria group bacterium]